jgi:hypothetical protein
MKDDTGRATGPGLSTYRELESIAQWRQDALGTAWTIQCGLSRHVWSDTTSFRRMGIY